MGQQPPENPEALPAGWGRARHSQLDDEIVVILDLAIPRLVQHIIDQGILAGNQHEVLATFVLMMVISAANTI